MKLNHSIHPNVLRFAGWSGIVSGIFFLTGVAIQMSSGWFPEEQLGKDNMAGWLTAAAQQQSLVLFGILCSIIAIVFFVPITNAFYRQLPEEDWRGYAGWAAHSIGIPTAFVVFSLALGFTWGLFGALESQNSEALASIAHMGMRGYLFGDDMATTLIVADSETDSWPYQHLNPNYYPNGSATSG